MTETETEIETEAGQSWPKEIQDGYIAAVHSKESGAELPLHL